MCVPVSGGACAWGVDGTCRHRRRRERGGRTLSISLAPRPRRTARMMPLPLLDDLQHQFTCILKLINHC